MTHREELFKAALANWFNGKSCRRCHGVVCGHWMVMIRWIPSYVKDTDVNIGAPQTRCDLLIFTADFVLHTLRLVDINKAVVTPP